MGSGIFPEVAIKCSRDALTHGMDASHSIYGGLLVGLLPARISNCDADFHREFTYCTGLAVEIKKCFPSKELVCMFRFVCNGGQHEEKPSGMSINRIRQLNELWIVVLWIECSTILLAFET